MKIKKILQKIIISIMTVLLMFNIVMPTIVKADVYGELFTPVQELVVGLGDALMKLIQKSLTGDGYVVTEYVSDDLLAWNRSKLYIPNYKVSPEKIFTNSIPAFDINFFNPSGDYEVIADDERINKMGVFVQALKDRNDPQASASYNYIVDLLKSLKDQSEECEKAYTNLISIYGMSVCDEVDKQLFYDAYDWMLENKEELSETTISTKESSAKILQSTISYWYTTLRNIAIIGLLSVLVYIGIRIVLSSTASDKSKYKEMLKDWTVAICLLFCMHYIMSFTITLADSVTDGLSGGGAGLDAECEYKDEETGEVIKYKGDRFMGDVRLKLQSSNDLAQKMSYTVIYVVLVIYTVVFSIIYLKRVIYIAFLTMIAPLVALTYPLDKMRDGKAQAFDMWMKEYMLNALIQPFHLILYYILVGTSLELVVSNPLYALVAIGFLMPAEKLLRKFFGLDKAGTTGVLGGALSGAMVMQAINSIKKHNGGKAGGGKTEGNSAQENQKNKILRTADSGKNTADLVDTIMGRSINRRRSKSKYRFV